MTLRPHASKILQYNTRINGVNIMKIMLHAKCILTFHKIFILFMQNIFTYFFHLILEWKSDLWMRLVPLPSVTVIKYVSWIECISWLGWCAISLVSAVSQPCSISLLSWKMNFDRAGQFFLAAVQGFRAAHVRRGLGTEWLSHTDDTLTQRHTDFQLNPADASSEHHWKHSILQHCITLDTWFVDRDLWINNLVNTAFISSLFACMALRQSKPFMNAK